MIRLDQVTRSYPARAEAPGGLIHALNDFSLQVEQLSQLAYALLSFFGDDGAAVEAALRALSEAHGVATDALRAACAPVLGELCAASVLVVPNDC